MPLAERKPSRGWRTSSTNLSEYRAYCLVTPLDISSSGGWHTTRRGVTLARGIWWRVAREDNHRVAAKCQQPSKGKSSQ